MKNKKQRGFTLIEAMVVIFIIGLLSMTAALGYGQMSRDKALETASQRVSQQISQSRDYAIFGKEIKEGGVSVYPCGYGVAMSKSPAGDNNASVLSLLYSSNFDRITLMAENKTCDEEILKNTVFLTHNTADELDYISDPTKKLVELPSVQIEEIKDNNGKNYETLTVLFSAPRGVSYFCDSSSVPESCDFKVFSQDAAAPFPAYFKVTLLIKDGSSTSARKYIKILPSGNIESLDN